MDVSLGNSSSYRASVITHSSKNIDKSSQTLRSSVLSIRRERFEAEIWLRRSGGKISSLRSMIIYSYRRKIRRSYPRNYLWGSDLLNESLEWKGDGLAITIHLEDPPEGRVIIGTTRVDDAVKHMELGELRQDEVCTINLKGMLGLWARLSGRAGDTHVLCTIHNLNR